MSEEKNRVMVELYDLSITERQDDRFGKVITSRSMNEDDLVKMAVSRRTDLNPTTLKAAMEILKESAIECLLRGDSVKFGLAFFSLDVKGVFLGDNAGWDPKQHKLIVRATPSAELRKKVSSATVKIRGMASAGMFINSVTDIFSGEINSLLSPGGGVNITGSKIKIAGEHPENGIYLEQQEGESVRIHKTSILINDPSKISFIVPANLPQGEYRLKINTQFTSGTAMLKEPRTYVFEHPLAVL